MNNNRLFDFSSMNLSYMIEARNLIKTDRVMAKIVLSGDETCLDFIENLTPEQLTMIGKLHNPIVAFRIDQKFLKEIMTTINSGDMNRMGSLDDRALLTR